MKVFTKLMTSFAALALSTFFIAGCAKDNPLAPDTGSSAPRVISVSPANYATSVSAGANVTVTFSEDMDPATITTATFILMNGASTVPCTVSYANKVATLNPTTDFSNNTIYSAKVTTGAKDKAGNPLASEKIWSFTTGAVIPGALAAVNLGTAANFAILAKSGISTVPTSAVTGDMGVSPIDSTAITGFTPMTLDATGAFSTCGQVVGKVYAADYAVPTPAYLTTAVGDMELAYADAAGRVSPDFTELGTGDISGLTLVRGLYKWSTGVLINTPVTLNGGPNDVWIFQISGDITMASGATVILTGGAQAKNVFWQTAGVCSLGTTAHLEGIVLSSTMISLATGASVKGRLLAQTAVTLDASTVTKP